jgi:hypothetical protein
VEALRLLQLGDDGHTKVEGVVEEGSDEEGKSRSREGEYVRQSQLGVEVKKNTQEKRSGR